MIYISFEISTVYLFLLDPGPRCYLFDPDLCQTFFFKALITYILKIFEENLWCVACFEDYCGEKLFRCNQKEILLVVFPWLPNTQLFIIWSTINREIGKNYAADCENTRKAGSGITTQYSLEVLLTQLSIHCNWWPLSLTSSQVLCSSPIIVFCTSHFATFGAIYVGKWKVQLFANLCGKVQLLSPIQRILLFHP